MYSSTTVVQYQNRLEFERLVSNEVGWGLDCGGGVMCWACLNFDIFVTKFVKLK